MEISGEQKMGETAGRRWPSRLTKRAVALAAVALLAATLAGCTYFQEQPEIEPDRFAPPAPD